MASTIFSFPHLLNVPEPDKLCNGAIGADVFRRRKQKPLRSVVSRIEDSITFKMLILVSIPHIP